MFGSSDRRPVISILTDFGLDGAVAACKGVMLDICREAQIIDIAHTIAKFAIRDGSFILRAALPYLPVGVHVAVVDPGVGTERRPVGLQVGRGDVLIGPDNGLLPPAADALGGVTDARELADRRWWLPETTSTFHGRDIFSPVAAHLAAGTATLADLGPPVALDSLVRLPTPVLQISDGTLSTTVVYVDSFGNLRLAGGLDDLRGAFGDLEAGAALDARLEGAAPLPVTYAPTFGAVAAGEALLYVDSSGGLALAESQGDLAARTGIRTGHAVTIER